MTNVEQKNIAVAQAQAHSRSKAESPLLGDGAFFAYLTKLLPIQAAEIAPSLGLDYAVSKDAQIAALTTSIDGKPMAGLRLPFAIPDAEPIKNESVALHIL